MPTENQLARDKDDVVYPVDVVYHVDEKYLQNFSLKPDKNVTLETLI
jgi:hypothetical protein